MGFFLDFVFFLILKSLKLHRISAEEEKIGQDMKSGGVINQMSHLSLLDYQPNKVENLRTNQSTKEDNGIYKYLENKNKIKNKNEIEMEIRNK